MRLISRLVFAFYDMKSELGTDDTGDLSRLKVEGGASKFRDNVFPGNETKVTTSQSHGLGRILRGESGKVGTGGCIFPDFLSQSLH